MDVTVLEHPLAGHYVTQLRDRRTPAPLFRELCRRVTSLLVVEATRDLPSRVERVETPLEPHDGSALDARIVVVAILRAGLGMAEPAMAMLPGASLGCVGMERDESTAVARAYYEKLPPLEGSTILVVDPMLATGGSARQAIEFLKAKGAEAIRMLSIVAAPEGVTHLHETHPDVPLWTAALDRALNDKKYILPGLGDFGDRLYGT